MTECYLIKNKGIRLAIKGATNQPPKLCEDKCDCYEQGRKNGIKEERERIRKLWRNYSEQEFGSSGETKAIHILEKELMKEK